MPLRHAFMSTAPGAATFLPRPRYIIWICGPCGFRGLRGSRRSPVRKDALRLLQGSLHHYSQRRGRPPDQRGKLVPFVEQAAPGRASVGIGQQVRNGFRAGGRARDSVTTRGEMTALAVGTRTPRVLAAGQTAIT